MFPFAGEDSAAEQRIAIYKIGDRLCEIQFNYVDAKMKSTKWKPDANQ